MTGCAVEDLTEILYKIVHKLWLTHVAISDENSSLKERYFHINCSNVNVFVLKNVCYSIHRGS